MVAAQEGRDPALSVPPEACLVAMLACSLFIYGLVNAFEAGHESWLPEAPPHLAAQVQPALALMDYKQSLCLIYDASYVPVQACMTSMLLKRPNSCTRSTQLRVVTVRSVLLQSTSGTMRTSAILPCRHATGPTQSLAQSHTYMQVAEARELAEQLQARLRYAPCAVTTRDQDIPFGDPHDVQPEQSSFRQLPTAWWLVFPGYRRRSAAQEGHARAREPDDMEQDDVQQEGLVEVEEMDEDVPDRASISDGEADAEPAGLAPDWDLEAASD